MAGSNKTVQPEERGRQMLERWLDDTVGVSSDDEAIDTHLGFVRLRGKIAYKVRRWTDVPGLVDYSTAAGRERLLREELRLNSALGSKIYKRVFALYRKADGSVDTAPPGDTIEHVLEMDRVESRFLLARRLQDPLSIELDAMSELGRAVRTMHNRCRPADIESVRTGQAMTFDYVSRAASKIPLDSARSLQAAVDSARRTCLGAGRNGLGCEIHGDLKAENVFLQDRPAGGAEFSPFDCIEFSRELRSQDPLLDLAALATDVAIARGPVWSTNLITGYFDRFPDRGEVEALHAYIALRSGLRATIESTKALRVGAALDDRQAWECVKKAVTIAQSPSLALRDAGSNPDALASV